MSAALRKAGVQQVPHGRRYAENEIFENLLNVWTHYGRPPTVSEMNRPPSVVGSNVYIKRYVRWRDALKVFIARANSEVDGPLSAESRGERSPTAEVPATSPSVVFATNELKTHVISSGRQPRLTRSTATNTQPEDRRAPNIGLRFKVLQRDNFKCVLCGDHPARNADCVLHVDHLIPWSKGGKTSEENLRTLCATCNIGRGNRFDG